MLKKLLSMTRAQRAEVVQSIDTKLVNEPWAAKRLAKMKGKQGGFTLLELLVVVAIIAAIAGTATILLRDTDRQASAAAHVAMMDELMKGISTYQVLNNGKFPDNFDSLMSSATGEVVPAAGELSILNSGLSDAVAPVTLTIAQAQLLHDFGLTKVRVVGTAEDPNGATETGDCGANIVALIANKGSDVTSSTIFRSTDANGCVPPAATGAIATLTGDTVTAVNGPLLTWTNATGAYERVNADPLKAASQTLVALGVGPSSDLFQVENRGAMTTVPAYRHVTATEYNRFTALLNVDTDKSEVRLQAIIDGAGDTKDEELGEWDGTRPTI